jgi:hypothetical protein
MLLVDGTETQDTASVLWQSPCRIFCRSRVLVPSHSAIKQSRRRGSMDEEGRYSLCMVRRKESDKQAL